MFIPLFFIHPISSYLIAQVTSVNQKWKTIALRFYACHKLYGTLFNSYRV